MSEYETEALSSLNQGVDLKIELVRKQNFQPMKNSDFFDVCFHLALG